MFFEVVERFEIAIPLSFRDKTLLHRALTHRSFLNEFPDFPTSDNERLEFLGDAVLGFVVGAYLYHRFPEQSEGFLTNIRAALVRRETLAEFARQLNLGQFLLMGHGEVESGGRNRPAILCAAFEALIGALYLDQGQQAVEAFLLPIVEPFLDELQRQPHTKDAKSRLQEYAQSSFQVTPRYQTVHTEGPDHMKLFTVEALVDNQVYGIGRGTSKREAEQEAALNALSRLEEENLTRLSQQAAGEAPTLSVES